MPFFAFLILFLLISSAQAGDSGPLFPSLLSEFVSQIDLYRDFVNEPIQASTFESADDRAYQTALKEWQSGNGKAAFRLFEEIARASGRSDWIRKEARVTLGYLYLNQNRPNEAIEEFSAIENERALREDSLNGMAEALVEQEEYVKAIAILEDLVREFPDGRYAADAYGKLGLCYSRLLSYKTSVRYFQKSLHLYSAELRALKALSQIPDPDTLFQRSFVFGNADSQWRTFFKETAREFEGSAFLQKTGDFFNLEDRVHKSQVFLGSTASYRQRVQEMRTSIQTVFQQFVRQTIANERRLLQDRSSETAVELARNMLLESSLENPVRSLK